MEYTPGPWEYCEINTDRFDEHAGPYGSHEDCIKIGTKVIKLSCFVYPGSYEDANEWRSNAQLIAAAPELLEACKELLIQSHGLFNDTFHPDSLLGKAWKKAKAAIDKAEGR